MKGDGTIYIFIKWDTIEDLESRVPSEGLRIVIRKQVTSLTDYIKYLSFMRELNINCGISRRAWTKFCTLLEVRMHM